MIGIQTLTFYPFSIQARLYRSPFLDSTNAYVFYTFKRFTLTHVLSETSGHQDAQVMLQSGSYSMEYSSDLTYILNWQYIDEDGMVREILRGLRILS